MMANEQRTTEAEAGEILVKVSDLLKGKVDADVVNEILSMLNNSLDGGGAGMGMDAKLRQRIAQAHFATSAKNRLAFDERYPEISKVRHV